MASFIAKLELEEVKGAVGYSGVPKTFIAWYYKLTNQPERARRILYQIELIERGESSKSLFALQPLKALLKDIKGGALRAKVAKAAKLHPVYTMTYGVFMVMVESFCAGYCSNSCDYDPDTPSIKKGLESLTSTIDTLMGSLEDMFK